MLNPAPAQSLSEDLLSKVDYLTPNRSELALLTRMSGESTVAKGMERLLEIGVSCCVTTQGAEGVVLMEKGGELLEEMRLEQVLQPLFLCAAHGNSYTM